MKVNLVAYTVCDWDGLKDMGYVPFYSETDADELAEAAGRLCYESFDRPNPATASNGTYLGNIISQQHFSVLEHGSATFFIDGVSRSLTHELVRHRHLSFSQLSQRYVDQKGIPPTIPPAIPEDLNINLPAYNWEYDEKIISELRGHYDEGQRLYELAVRAGDLAGLPKKVVRGAMRAFLLECTSTKLVVTGNHRAWRDMLTKRLSPGADEEIRRLAVMIRDTLKVVAPNTYQDY